LPRFYAPDLDPNHDIVTLSPDEAHHLTRVLRLGPGAEVSVFDGRGTEFRARVEDAVRDSVSLRLLERVFPPPSLAVRTVVVQAVLKGDSMDDAIRDATMMGAEAIEPVITAHTDVKASFIKRPETLDRWRRVALAAVKQCRRATLPEVEPPREFSEWLASPSGAMKLIFVEPTAKVAVTTLKAALEYHVPTRAEVLLGPEGGWSQEELEAAIAIGCVPVTLGPLTLRAESMPVAALAALAAVWQV
jgi:16S rRNA (uracil1498-N3)-methyltransferase